MNGPALGPLTQDQVERLLSLAERATGLLQAHDEIQRTLLATYWKQNYPRDLQAVYEALREDLEEITALATQHWSFLYD